MGAWLGFEDVVIAWVGRWWMCGVAVLLVLLMQGPALVTQEVAWARMLVSYTQERGLLRGVTETFDGRHPCAMCVKAEAMREDEKKRQDPLERSPGKMKKDFKWAEMVPPRVAPVPGARECGTVPPAGVHVVLLWGRGRDLPPLPPPEVVA